MKKIKYFLSAVLVVGVLFGNLVGCASQWNQDPLAGKDAVLKDGQLKPTVPEAPKPIDSNNVIVDAVDLYSFREGTMGELTITVRILENDYVPTVSVENMSDFPGANFTIISYDKPTRLLTTKFTWTPALGVVSGNTGLEDKKDIKLLVLGNKPNSKVIVGHRIVKTSVGKVLNVPEIFSVSRNSLSMREGETTSLTLKVRDKDAGNSAISAPSIQVLPMTGYANLSQFVTVTQVSVTGINEFSINLTIDLSAAEVTKSRGSFGFTLKAVSRFNQVSSGQNVLATVFTSFADLQNTWVNVLEMPLGPKKEFQFMIFDPKAELSVAAPTFTGLPGSATIDCQAVSLSNQLCTFSWTPDFTVTPGDYTIQAQVNAKNQDSQDTFIKNISFDLKLRVTAAPPVSPLALQGGK